MSARCRRIGACRNLLPLTPRPCEDVWLVTSSHHLLIPLCRSAESSEKSTSRERAERGVGDKVTCRQVKCIASAGVCLPRPADLQGRRRLGLGALPLRPPG